MREFMWGTLTISYAIVGLAFVRCWKVSGQRLFAYFAAAFVVMAADWAALAAVPQAYPARYLLYLVRLLAFVLIIIGIVDTNRSLPRT